MPHRIWSPLAAALVVLASTARADEEKIALDKLPKDVVAAVQKRFPKATMKEASKEVEDGKTTFEVAVTADGKKIDVSLTADGVITGLEKEIAAADLPKPVAAALATKYPKATYKTIEEVVKVAAGKETLAYYEIMVETAAKKKIEVEVLADGAIKKETAIAEKN